MNDAIKAAIELCSLVGIYILNNILFETLFDLDMGYHKNILWSILFSFSLTAIQLAILRMATGKLAVRVVWETKGEKK